MARAHEGKGCGSLVIADQIRMLLAYNPAVDPLWRVDFLCTRLERDQVKKLIKAIYAGTEDLSRFVEQEITV